MRAGRIKISEELVRRWLQFPNATILEVNYDIPHEILEITLEDREMPEINNGDAVPIVTPMYIKYEDSSGNSVAIRQPLNE